jgi:ABC-type branched-subunit amino acid transport system ATPase component
VPRRTPRERPLKAAVVQGDATAQLEKLGPEPKPSANGHGASFPGGHYFDIAGVSLRFGGLQVLDDVNLHVDQGEIVGLIGPNGAGKTTLFDVISGFHKPHGGTISFKGVNLVDERPYRRAWLGMGRTFQTARLFQNETVLDTVKTACHRRMQGGAVTGLLTGMVRTTKAAKAEAHVDRRARQIIDRLGLGDYAPKMCSELSYGTLRLTELATILAMEPEFVLLDEPSSGIAQRETEALGPLLLELRQELGATFLLIEHDMPLIMGISDRIVALAAGHVLAEGTPAEVQANEEVVEAYLGGKVDLEEVVA